MKSSLKIALLFLASALCTIGATSCRTIHGIGADLEHASDEHRGR